MACTGQTVPQVLQPTMQLMALTGTALLSCISYTPRPQVVKHSVQPMQVSASTVGNQGMSLRGIPCHNSSFVISYLFSQIQLLYVIFQAACQVSMPGISTAAIFVMTGGNSSPQSSRVGFRTTLSFFMVAFFYHSKNQDNSGERPDVKNHWRSTFRTGQHSNTYQAAHSKPPFSCGHGKSFVHAPNHDSFPCINLSIAMQRNIEVGLMGYQCNRSV
jgi:hypothetical protein